LAGGLFPQVLRWRDSEYLDLHRVGKTRPWLCGCSPSLQARAGLIAYRFTKAGMGCNRGSLSIRPPRSEGLRRRLGKGRLLDRSMGKSLCATRLMTRRYQHASRRIRDTGVAGRPSRPGGRWNGGHDRQRLFVQRLRKGIQVRLCTRLFLDKTLSGS